jgi:hypothetical protein
MNIRQLSYHFFRIGIASALVAAGSVTFAAEPPTSAAPAPSKEVREKMAAMHEQMAACLRSDKSITECRTEAMQKCHDMMGQQGCQGMGTGMGMGNMGMPGGMKKPAPSTPKN